MYKRNNAQPRDMLIDFTVTSTQPHITLFYWSRLSDLHIALTLQLTEELGEKNTSSLVFMGLIIFFNDLCLKYLIGVDMCAL